MGSAFRADCRMVTTGSHEKGASDWSVRGSHAKIERCADLLHTCKVLNYIEFRAVGEIRL
jgi:hypothetical protein